MIKKKYLIGLLVLSLGACQSHHMDQKMGHNRDHMMKRKMGRNMDHMMTHKENSKMLMIPDGIKECIRKDTLIRAENFEKGDYETFFNFAIEDSQKTKGFTLNAIGTMYHFGAGVKVDYSRAKDLYERALEYGNGEAANHLARLYANGEGVERNEARAREYYKISCDKGYDVGCENCQRLKIN